MTFYRWLHQQVAREDAVGAFARYAVKDRIFPHVGRKLNLFLHRYDGMPIQREGLKIAHREWRLMMKHQQTGGTDVTVNRSHV